MAPNSGFCFFFFLLTSTFLDLLGGHLERETRRGPLFYAMLAQHCSRRFLTEAAVADAALVAVLPAGLQGRLHMDAVLVLGSVASLKGRGKEKEVSQRVSIESEETVNTTALQCN